MQYIVTTQTVWSKAKVGIPYTQTPAKANPHELHYTTFYMLALFFTPCHCKSVSFLPCTTFDAPPWFLPAGVMEYRWLQETSDARPLSRLFG